jgi:hypothetical protein
MGHMDTVSHEALQRGAPPALPPGLFDVGRQHDESTRKERIRCPACQWQPAASSRWFCQETGAPEHFTGGCGEAWNTFTTRGRCPGCQYQWRWTACLKCDTWSLHDAWYESEDADAGRPA